MAKYPIFWLWKAILHPTFTLVYSLYLLAKKGLFKLYQPLKDRTVSFFTSKYVMHVAVVTLTFLVTATNIHAGEVAPLPEGVGDKSILASASDTQDDELVLEEATAEVGTGQETSYLDGQALSLQDSRQSDESFDGTDDGTYVDAEEFQDYVSPFDNAVHVQPEAVPTEQQPPTRTAIVEYTVEESDTVSSIAQKFGLKMDTLLTVNNLGSRGLIRSGQVLKILPVDGIIYKVKKGDTLLKIANTYKSESEKIADINGLGSGSELSVGSELVLPDGRLPAPPAPKKPTRLATDIRNIFVPPPAADRVGTSKFLWPTAVHRITQYYKRRHTGVDIAGPVGTPIYAAEDGVVLTSGWNTGGYGNMTVINHGNGIYTRYGHAVKNLTKVGDSVKRGDVIALMGSTGRSTGPHLHFEVMLNGTSRRTNPLDYVR